jgi:GDP-4-dehydro-6-deoxy-D-mannose reductase
VRILITGISGFVGRHLATQLHERYPQAEIHGTTRQTPFPDLPFATCHALDLRDETSVTALVTAIQPDQIYHLAAQAFVPRSFSDPWETIEINVRAQLNLFLACIALSLSPRILVVSSAEIYGIVDETHIPMREDLPPRPTSPYSVSKVTQDMLALQYYLSHNLQVMRARPFNHFGPGQNERFVAPAFALQIAQIEANLNPPIIQVGDLSAKRDFTDVRDIVNAYRLIMESGTPGAVYNVASGVAHSIAHLLQTLIGLANKQIEVQVDESRLRPVHIPILLGDAQFLRNSTGWAPQYSFEASLQDVLEDCRQRVQSGNLPQSL